MLKSELLELVKDVKEDVDIDNIIEPKYLTIDKLKSKVKSNDNNEIKSWFDSEKDTHSSKSLETWKAGSSGQEYAVQKDYELYPDRKPKDPKDEEIEKLKRQIAENKKLEAKEKLKISALQKLNEDKLPTELIDKLIGEDENTTNENISKFKSMIEKVITDTKQNYTKSNSYEPPGGNNDSVKTYEDLIKNADNMTAEQIAEQFSNIQ